MIPKEEKQPGSGNSVNADKSVSSGKQHTPEYGAPSAEGSREAAGRAASGNQTGSPQQSTSTGAYGSTAGTKRSQTENPDTEASVNRDKGTGSTEKPDSENTERAQEKGVSDRMKSQFSHIKGWGIDADSDNDPTYPMRHRKTGALANTWNRPSLQPPGVELLFSTERNSRPAVFGTASPPSGLSGMIRRYAFKYSESDYRHWLPLVLADRINVVEGLVGDIAHGRIPNPVAERGLRVVWKYNKKAFVRKAAVRVGIIAAATAAVIFLRNKKK